MSGILVVDDDADIALFVRAVLEGGGFATLEPASNGAEALERIEADAPDLLVLGLMMPVLDGFGVLERLPAGAPPVVAMSARRDPETVQRVLALGAKRFVAKPFDAEDLVDTVRSVLAEAG